MRNIIMTILLLLATSPAFAQANKPQVIDKYIQANAPYGEGTMTRLFLKIYDASLWTDSPTWSMDSKFAFVIKYRMDIDGDDLVDRSIEEMQHESTLPEDKVIPYKEQLTKVFPDVKSGDTITALYDPKKGISFYHNDHVSGTIRDHDLAERFLLIWFSPKTSEPKLRQALLGNHGA